MADYTSTFTGDEADSNYSGMNTICYRSAATGTFGGAPAGASQQTSSSWSTVVGALAAGKRVLLRNGDTWNDHAAGAAAGA